MDSKPALSNEPLFIPPGANVTAASRDVDHFAKMSRATVRNRWQTPRGIEILEAWKKSQYDREQINQLVGKIHDHLDLRGVPLSDVELRGRNLEQVDFFYAVLQRADLSQCDLKNSYLSEADIRSARFDWCKMDGVLTDNVQYDAQTNFQGVDITVVNFNLAALLRDLASSQQRINHLRKRNPVLAFFLWVTSDYGMSPQRFFCWLLMLIIGFAVAYAYIPGIISRQDVLSALYFSVVSFTTLGYGDIVPLTPLGQMLAIAEVSCGYLMGGVFITILARKLLLG